MKRIILHWTAGAREPNNTDFQHYHYLINGNGLIVEGKFPVSANKVCKTDAKGNALYAAHCGGGNTGSIGIAMCGMANYKSPKSVGQYPLTSKQVETTFKKIAELCKEYNIPITPEAVMTHYEFGKSHPKTSSYGKIDVTYLPSYPNVKADEMGDFIRNKVLWYYKKL